MHDRPRYVRSDSAVYVRRRRFALGAMLLLIIVPAILLGRQLFSSDPEPVAETPALGTGEEAPTDAAAEALGDSPGTLRDAKAGISASYPADWDRSARSGVHVMESPDGCAAVAVSDPGSAARADSIREDAIAELQEALGEGASVSPGEGRTIGGLEATGATVSVGSGGDRRSALIAVAAGEERAYLIQVTLASSGCVESLAGAQAIVNSLRLTR